VIVLAAAGVVLAACNDPASFRPAQGVADLPRTEKAYRIFEVSNDCKPIGDLEGTTIQAIATTVANHGGTHFLVTDERVLQQYVSASPSLAVGYSQSQGRLESTKQIKAEAYVCPSYKRTERKEGADAGAQPWLDPALSPLPAAVDAGATEAPSGSAP